MDKRKIKQQKRNKQLYNKIYQFNKKIDKLKSTFDYKGFDFFNSLTFNNPQKHIGTAKKNIGNSIHRREKSRKNKQKKNFMYIH